MKQKDAHSIQGPMLAVFLVFLVLISSWLFFQRRWWLPDLASVHGIDVDRVFYITLAITGVLFVLLQLILAYFSMRFREKEGRTAQYWINPGLEKRFALVAGIIILLVDLALFDLGESQWFKAWGAPPEDSLIVEVTGEQFMWNFRYPGKDNTFGRTDPHLISSSNPLGVDKQDPASKDDILSINQLHLPQNRPVRLIIRAKDVIHSLFLPHFRVKQDAVPGMTITLWFIPAKSGELERHACRRLGMLCGFWLQRLRAGSSFLAARHSNGRISFAKARGCLPIHGVCRNSAAASL